MSTVNQALSRAFLDLRTHEVRAIAHCIADGDHTMPIIEADLIQMAAGVLDWPVCCRFKTLIILTHVSRSKGEA